LSNAIRLFEHKREERKLETYLTVEELAAYFKFTEQTIRRWIVKREIPYHKINNSVRFRLSEIEQWVEKREAAKAKKQCGQIQGDLFDKPDNAEASTETGGNE
jgi:excisionase family DNA binding protein